MIQMQPSVWTMIIKSRENINSRSFCIDILNILLHDREKSFLALTNFMSRIILIEPVLLDGFEYLIEARKAGKLPQRRDGGSFKDSRNRYNRNQIYYKPASQISTANLARSVDQLFFAIVESRAECKNDIHKEHEVSEVLEPRPHIPFHLKGNSNRSNSGGV